MVEYLEEFRFDEALKLIWYEISSLDRTIQDKTPWKLAGEDLHETLLFLVEELRSISNELKPFLPETAEKIKEQFKGPKIISQKPLFPRIYTP